MINDTTRTILHCDMNGFYASVELLDYPQYRNVPMAVCGNPDSRHGIILAKNDLAKKYRVTTGETLGMAQKKCPTLVCVQPHHDKYNKYSKLINQIYLHYTDMVEPFSIDESWLDVTASLKLFGSGKVIADEIRETVKKELGLTLSAGVSYNKFLAKMGSEHKKPDATTVINQSNLQSLLWPKKIEEMFFVGKKTAAILKKAHIYTIGNLAKSDKQVIASLLGRNGGLIHDYANGIDNSPVALFHHREKAKSIGHSITFSRNLTNLDEIKTGLSWLCDRVTMRLRKAEMKAAGLRVEIRYATFNEISKQKQFDQPTNFEKDFFRESFTMIEKMWQRQMPIRLLSVSAINLVDENAEEQLSMLSGFSVEEREEHEKFERTLDDIRKKFGTSSIEFGRTLSGGLGLSRDNKKFHD